MKRVIATLARGALLMIAVVACSSPAGTIFRTTAVQPDGSYPMPITLSDETGLVAGIETALGDATGGVDQPNVRREPDDPNAVILTFFTGACDDSTATVMRRSDTGFNLYVQVNEGFSFGGCTAQLLIRGIRIRFSEPVAADSIVAIGTR